jgi:hypothetical protein
MNRGQGDANNGATVPSASKSAWGFPNFAPAFWSAVVGASPLPLSHAGRTFVQRTTSPRARKAANPLALHRRTPKRRRLRMGLPEPRASVLECGCGRSPLPLLKAGRAFIQRTTSPRARKAAKSLRSIAALQNVADFARGFPNCAPASWSAVVGEALYRFRMPDGRPSSAPPLHALEKRRIRSAPSPHSKTSPTSRGASRTSRQRFLFC